MADRTQCACDARKAVQDAGEFAMAWEVGGWVFIRDPSRWVRDSWKNSYHGTENHDGEPYVWSVCPFCGHPLPHVSLTPTTITDAELRQAERGPLPTKGYRPQDPPPPASFCSED